MKYLYFLLTFAFAIDSFAFNVDGVWKYSRGGDLFDSKKAAAPPRSKIVTISKEKEMHIDAFCRIKIDRYKLPIDAPFRSLLKSGYDEKDILRFISGNLGFNGAKLSIDSKEVPIHFSAKGSPDCSEIGDNFYFEEDKMLAVRGGGVFYVFSRVGEEKSVEKKFPKETFAADKYYSLLPFNLRDYSDFCSKKKSKSAFQSFQNCAPKYHYYFASRESKDSLSKLIGAHEYEKNGAGFATEDYNNPVSHGLNPVFTVFPPIGEVIPVRVDDLESKGERRERMNGVFLAIKRGKVTDQLNSGCDIDEKYVFSCEGVNYKLLPSGRFERIKVR